MGEELPMSTDRAPRAHRPAKSGAAKVKWSCSLCGESGELNLPEPLPEIEIGLAVLHAHGLTAAVSFSEGPDAHAAKVSYRVWFPRPQSTPQSLF